MVSASATEANSVRVGPGQRQGLWPLRHRRAGSQGDRLRSPMRTPPGLSPRFPQCLNREKGLLHAGIIDRGLGKHLPASSKQLISP